MHRRPPPNRELLLEGGGQWFASLLEPSEGTGTQPSHTEGAAQHVMQSRQCQANRTWILASLSRRRPSSTEMTPRSSSRAASRACTFSWSWREAGGGAPPCSSSCSRSCSAHAARAWFRCCPRTSCPPKAPTLSSPLPRPVAPCVQAPRCPASSWTVT